MSFQLDFEVLGDVVRQNLRWGGGIPEARNGRNKGVGAGKSRE